MARSDEGAVAVRGRSKNSGRLNKPLVRTVDTVCVKDDARPRSSP